MNNKKVFLLILLVNLFSFTFYSQWRDPDYRQKNLLTKPVQLPDYVQFEIIIEFIKCYYSGSFQYYDELKNGRYNFETPENNTNDVYLNILSNAKVQNDKKTNIIAKIKLKKIRNLNGNYEIIVEKSEIERFIDKNRFDNFGRSTGKNYQPVIIQKDSILIDKMILYDDEVPQENWKILNRGFTLENLKNQYGEEAQLFKNLESATILRYNYGNNSKLLSLDAGFHSILYFDSDIFSYKNQPINGYYGEYGPGNGEFVTPTGITAGRELASDQYIYYPIYIADNHNFRIVKANFIVNEWTPQLSHFDNNSFTVLTSANLPNDVAYFQHLDDSTKDKLWVTESNPITPYITCYSPNGIQLQRFSGYMSVHTNQVFLFEPNTISRVCVYNDYFAAMSFTDNIRNSLISCQLNPNGTARSVNIDGNLLIVVDDILTFPNEEQIKSASFQKTSFSTGAWPYIWVVTDNMIHCVKMNSNAHCQYLASTNKPFNTDVEFSNLKNVISSNGFFNLLTFENWNDSYGIREYLPYVNIYSDSLENYCLDSTDLMRFKAVFTNDCWLYMKAYRLNRQNNWEIVKILKFNGATPSNDTAITKFQYAGQNQSDEGLYIDFKLGLPIEDYEFGGQVKLVLKGYTDYDYPPDPNNPKLYREYVANIENKCFTKSVGCPFLYVKAEDNEYKPDNNLLHRMEFSVPSTDIKDVYKLRFNPLINNNKIELSIIENENDVSLFNQVKLYAIDYPENKKLGITEDNVIVTYDSISAFASDSVMYNYTENITNKLNYHDPSKYLTIGHADDSTYAHFSYIVKEKHRNQNIKFRNSISNNEQRERETRAESKNSNRFNLLGINKPVAFVTFLQNLESPVQTIKDTVGYLTAQSVNENVSSKMFARRELGSEIIVPLFRENDYIDNVDIKWKSDFRMKYVGAVNLEYDNNFILTEVPINTAHCMTSTIDSIVTSALTDIDGISAEVNSTTILKIIFDASILQWSVPPPNTKRAFVIDVTGQYSVGDNITLNKDNGILPLTYKLSQNYPNPFNPITKINYELPNNSLVNLVIYDVLGREVKRIVNNVFKQAGRYTVEFDATNYASGVYFYRIEAGTFVMSKKMVLVK